MNNSLPRNTTLGCWNCPQRRWPSSSLAGLHSAFPGLQVPLQVACACSKEFCVHVAHAQRVLDLCCLPSQGHEGWAPLRLGKRPLSHEGGAGTGAANAERLIGGLCDAL